ncbi:hypothetical protein H2203_008023 [Taxawa tesnikishii (nom. ined.)]|nr:hypothetical protein H2203_008023 [Dothideales sp. JES 119]
MPSVQRQTPKPIIVERRPSPSSPLSSVPPRAVRFPSTTDLLITGYSRPLTTTEAWSLYRFETHALSCASCYKPYEVYKSGRQLCSTGHALAQDVAIHVYRKDGEIYSVGDRDVRAVRVEVPPGYDHTQGLLKAMSRGLLKRAKTPVVSHDRTYYIPSRPRRSRDSDATAEEKPKTEKKYRSHTKPAVVVQPAQSSRGGTHDDRSIPSSSSKSRSRTKYRPIVVEWPEEDKAVLRTSNEDSREDKLRPYRDEGVGREGEAYRVEIREPERRDKRERKEKRRNYWR